MTDSIFQYSLIWTDKVSANFKLNVANVKLSTFWRESFIFAIVFLLSCWCYLIAVVMDGTLAQNLCQSAVHHYCVWVTSISTVPEWRPLLLCQSAVDCYCARVPSIVIVPEYCPLLLIAMCLFLAAPCVAWLYVVMAFLSSSVAFLCHELIIFTLVL